MTNKGATVVIEFHAWKGLRAEGGPLVAFAHLGFVTIGCCPVLLTERLRDLLGAAKKLTGKDKELSRK